MRNDESLMMSSSREVELPTKQENVIAANSKAWPGLTNPRIVRVSRAFGGKDRHSKVTTIKGLRDRRVRLSVPTAIQLYDLQDRLGLDQPSKVVDWLINAAQHEIDKLPPLPMLPGNFIQFSRSLAIPQKGASPQSPSHPSIMKDSNEDGALPYGIPTNRGFSDPAVDVPEDGATWTKPTYWNSDASQLAREKENQRLVTEDHRLHNAQVHSSLLGLFGNAVPYASYYHSETSSAYASQLGNPTSQMEALPTMIFSPYMAPSAALDARQLGHFEPASLTSQDLTLHFMASKHQNSQDMHES